MRKIREVLRLYFAAALSIRAIARSLGTSPSTVGEYLRRAKVAGVSWPVPEAIDDAGLERRLFPALPSSHTSRPLPEWSEVRRELRGKNVTLALLWQEYKAVHPEGLQYSRFCEQYRAWAGKLDLVMRQEHRAGERLFIDYAGQTMPVVDPETGEVWQAQVFVAVLGASSYTFAEATQGASHHRDGAHAREAPPDGRLDAGPFHPLGREDRAGDRRLDHRRPPFEVAPISWTG